MQREGEPCLPALLKMPVRIPKTCAYPSTARRPPAPHMPPKTHRPAQRKGAFTFTLRPQPPQASMNGDAPVLGARSLSEPVKDDGQCGLPRGQESFVRQAHVDTGAAVKLAPLAPVRREHITSASSASSRSTVSRPSSTSEIPSDYKPSFARDNQAGRKRKSVRQMTTVELMTNPRGPVLDYSFLQIEDINELRSVLPRSGYRERPPDTIEITDKRGQTLVAPNPLAASWTPPPPGPGGQRLVTQGLKLSNNLFASLPGCTHIILREVLERSWLLRWIDLSFNQLEDIPEVLASYQRLNTLYLHANRIRSASQAKCLSRLQSLHSLTLHGNPCESGKNYKKIVLVHCAALRKLDFSTVTKQDRVNAEVFGKSRAAAKPRPEEPSDEEPAPPEALPAGSRGLLVQASYEASVARALAIEREELHGTHGGPHA